jgi:rRNA processing protein Krr1/Pno1
MSKSSEFDGVMAEAANLAADRLVEYLSAARGMGDEAWHRLENQAKVGAVVVASKVRYEASINNRRALEQQRQRLIGREGGGSGPS